MQCTFRTRYHISISDMGWLRKGATNTPPNPSGHTRIANVVAHTHTSPRHRHEGAPSAGGLVTPSVGERGQGAERRLKELVA